MLFVRVGLEWRCQFVINRFFEWLFPQVRVSNVLWTSGSHCKRNGTKSNDTKRNKQTRQTLRFACL